MLDSFLSNRRGIAWRLGTGFGALLATLLACATLALWQLSELDVNLRQVLEHEARSSQLAWRLQAHVHSIGEDLRQAILSDSGEEVNANLARAMAAQTALLATERALESTVAGGAANASLQTVTAATPALLAALQQAAKATRSGDLDDARNALTQPDTERARAAMTRAVQELSAEAEGRMADARRHSAATHRRAQLMLGALTALAVLAAAAIGWRITRSVVLPARQATTIARRIAAGELTNDVVADRHDELGEMLHAMQGMQLALRQSRENEQRLQADLRAQQERARVTLISIADAVLTTDVQGRVETMNPSAEALTGWSAGEAAGRPLDEVAPLIDERTLQPASCLVTATLTSDADAERRDGDELAIRQRDLGTRAVEVAASRLHDAGGSLIGMTVVLRDVSVMRRMAQRISWAATHDTLTGLVNRREFENRVEAALVSAANSDRHHVVCFIDLDQFKVVNDTCGHAAGDGMLRGLATVLQQRLRGSDTLARLGGDEFGVLLEGCTIERAQAVCEHLLSTVRDYRFTWNDRIFSVGASIGLAEANADSASVAEVFGAADAACYWAKEQGRNRVCVHRPDNADLAQRRHEMDWASRLNAALDGNRFVLHYQPYRALAVGGRGGPHIEILLRMLDEEGRIVPPGSFLPAAERFNVMPRIDRWVIEQVFSRYASLDAALGPGLVCAINLSGTTLNSEGLFDYIKAQGERHAVPAGSVCFEITETAAVNNIRKTDLFLRELRAHGYLFALDDFGIGTSSFAYLKTLPVDYLKIDGTFVRNIANDPVDRAMVETINRIGHLMGLQTVGEYAESESIIGALQSIGVDFAQGYAVQRPTPLPAAGARSEPAPLPDAIGLPLPVATAS